MTTNCAREFCTSSGFWRIFVIAAVMASLTSVTARASAPGEPINVKPEAMSSISVSQMQSFIRIPDNMTLPVNGLKNAFAKRLKSLGYPAPDGRAEKAGRMSLGNRLAQFDCERKDGWLSLKVCSVGVVWELRDNWKDGVVYKTVTRFRREVVTEKAMVESELIALFTGAIDSLLTRPAFVDIMTRRPGDAPPTTPSNDKAPIQVAEFASCDAAKISLPKNIETSMEATLLIRHGNVTGSAFYITTDGLALTAFHVVQGVKHLKARDHFGNTFSATVLRKDPKHDVALIQVDTKSSKCMGYKEELPKVGEELYAIGSPGGEDLAFTVSRGIVSGIRSWEEYKFIQTDASVNAGNSGGPLLDKKGQVVAVVAWKIVYPGFEGLGFGVPVTSALEKLALRPGEKTSLKVAPAPPHKRPQMDVVEDKEDPPAGELAIVATTQPKQPIVSFRQRYLHNGGRKFMLISSPVLIVGGAALGTLSWWKYKKEVNDHEGGTDPIDDLFAPAAVDDEENSTWRMPEKDFKRLLALNIAGWSSALVGTGMFVLFFVTPRDREKIAAELEKQDTADAARTRRVRLGLAFTGNGWSLNGTF